MTRQLSYFVITLLMKIDQSKNNTQKFNVLKIKVCHRSSIRFMVLRV